MGKFLRLNHQPRLRICLNLWTRPMTMSLQRQATTPILLTCAVVSLLWYVILLLNPANIGDPVAYIVLVMAEVLGMIQLVGTWLTVIIGKPSETPYTVVLAREVMRKNPKVAGKVAVFVPVAGEPVSIISQTVRAARDITFPHETYILDDGRSDDVRELAKSLSVGYIRRGDNAGWKAGNINNALRNVTCDFFLILDSDFVAKPEILSETLPWLLADASVAFVQTPQYFRNTDGFVSGGTAEAQEVFYRHVQTAKNAFNAAFCVGTNVVFRTNAIRAIGGMYDESHSEDIWTSYLLHERGHRSVYLPLTLATGLAPDTVDAYFRQQFRWARGGFEILFKKNPLFNSGLTLDQKLQYFQTSMFFTSGFSVCCFFILPLLYVYFGWKPLSTAGTSWAVHFLPYFIFFYGAMLHLLGRRPLWRSYVISCGAFSAQIAACLSVLTGFRVRWSASGVVRSNIDHIKAIMFHLLFLFLTLAAVPVMLTQRQDFTLTCIITACLAWNAALLFSFCREALPGFRKAPVTVTQFATA